MDRSRFDEAVQFAERYRRQVEADWPEAAAKYYHTAPADSRPEQLSVWLLRSAEFPTVWDALDLIAARLLRDGKPLPRELALWLADKLEKKRRRPQRQGQCPLVNALRNRIIFAVVKRLEADGLTATRNRKKVRTGDPGRACAEGGSACDAVGEAFGMSYKNVEQVWGVFRGSEKLRELVLNRAEHE